MLPAPSAATVEYAMSTSQHSQLSIVPGAIGLFGNYKALQIEKD